MATIKIIVTIKGGSGKVTITMAGIPDIEINNSGETDWSLPKGDQFIMVGAIPPVGGSIEVSFLQGEGKIASHTYKSAKVIPFILEVS